MRRRCKPLEDRLWAKVRVLPSGCWEWTGHTSHGYGKISRGRRGEGMVGTHVAAYELVVGLVPRGLQLDHLCRVRRCCNPAHLEPVTCRENLRRGNGWSGRHYRKTHCPAGHPLDGANLSRYHLRRGERKCLTCHAARERRRKARLREEKVA